MLGGWAVDWPRYSNNRYAAKWNAARAEEFRGRVRLYRDAVGVASGTSLGAMRRSPPTKTPKSNQFAVRHLVRSYSLRRDFRMPIEPSVLIHLHDDLEGRLLNLDKQREIDLYYELINSGHSVGEILNAVGTIV